MKKDIIILTACVSVIAGIIVCTRSPAKAETTNNNLIMIEKNIDCNVIEIKDKTTGVHYLKTPEGLTVMYNADGTLKVTK